MVANVLVGAVGNVPMEGTNVETGSVDALVAVSGAVTDAVVEDWDA